VKKLLEKYLIVKYILTSYAKTLLISLAVLAAVFAVLKFTGWYAGIESALDLQYNSPLILVPLYGFAVLAVLCFFVGFLIYFYKYKRPKIKTRFYKVFSSILEKND